MSNTSSSKYLAILLGHLCGDAAGGVLEFYKGVIDDSRCEFATSMKGGGNLNLGPGQITDDGELTLCLLDALFQNKNHKQELYFPIDEIARNYTKWYKSNPFDCGMTCGRTFCNFKGDESDIGMKMINIAMNISMASEANGSLMRVSPIAIWGLKHKLSLQQISTYAKMDALLSHPNSVCQDANAIYCCTIVSLVSGGTMQDIEDHIKTQSYCSKVIEWLAVAKEMKDLTSYKEANINIGHVKHAFIMAMFFAYNGKDISYENGIHSVLKCGGDTDTNAAICGAILGALHGLNDTKGIPRSMYEPVLKFDCVSYDIYKNLLGHNRPREYNVNHILKKIGIL